MKSSNKVGNCTLIFVIMHFVISISINCRTIDYTLEQIHAIRKRICSKIDQLTCAKCGNYNSVININVFSYGVPFASGPEYFNTPCDCNNSKRINKLKKLCAKLDKIDTLPRDVDLRDLLLKEEAKTETEHEHENENFNEVQSNLNLRFKQTNNIIKSNNSNSKIKNSSPTCDCLNQKDLQSLFCYDKCKPFTNVLKKAQSFYDNQLEDTEKWFNKEINKYK